jgi:alditol oxidase
MKRKTFLKTYSIMLTGSLLPSFSSCNEPTKATKAGRKNWAGNYQYKAENFHQPQTVEQIQTLVKSLDKQKTLGSCHCFNDIADSPSNQISSLNLNKVVAIDEKAMTVTVEAGAKYGQFAPELHKKGYALHNLASLPHISVGGACSTATHGSGVKNGNLASAVAAFELVTPSGELVQLSRKDGEDFNSRQFGRHRSHYKGDARHSKDL